MNSYILPWLHGYPEKELLDALTGYVGMNSFVSCLKPTLLGALKSKLELVAEFWSAKLHLNHRRANLQTQFINSRQLVTYLAAKGLA